MGIIKNQLGNSIVVDNIDNALIISGVKEVVENNTDGINNINCNDNNCITWWRNSTCRW